MSNIVGPADSVATFEAKEALIRQAAFPQAPESERQILELPPAKAYEQVDEQLVHKALHSQTIGKAPGMDMLNFAAIRLLWSWDKGQVVGLAKQRFRLSVHPRVWHTAKRILTKKANRATYILLIDWWIISLLNCMGKVIEKVAAIVITEH